jgi:hypothetical protein
MTLILLAIRPNGVPIPIVNIRGHLVQECTTVTVTCLLIYLGTRPQLGITLETTLMTGILAEKEETQMEVPRREHLSLLAHGNSPME